MTNTRNLQSSNKTQKSKKTTKNRKISHNTANSNETVQTIPLDLNTQNSTLNNINSINLKKVESGESEITCETNILLESDTSHKKQNSFFKDLWYSLKEYFAQQ